MRRLREKLGWKMRIFCLAGCLAVCLGGCGSAKNFSGNMAADTFAVAENNYSGSAQEAGGGYYMDVAVSEESYMEDPGAREINDSAANAYSDRKLIKTVNLSVETKEFDLLMVTLEDQVDTLGGYIENMDTYNGSSYSGYRSSRNANMTIRIPKNELNGFLETISGISNVISRSENVEDVTLSYVDIESHRDVLRTEQERLLELLERAESIEDIITIEDRLSNVRYQLESMEAQLRTYDNKVDYSTVYLNIQEVRELTPVEEETTLERMAGGFMDSLKDIGEGIKEFFIWFVVHIPYLVIWGGVIFVVILLIKKICRKRKNRKQKETAPVSAEISGKETQK